MLHLKGNRPKEMQVPLPTKSRRKVLSTSENTELMSRRVALRRIMNSARLMGILRLKMEVGQKLKRM